MSDFSERPKRALIAYCTMAERLRSAGTNMPNALVPFFAEAVRPYAGQLFDAGKISASLKEIYDLDVPRLAVLGLSEHLEQAGVLIVVNRYPKVVYKCVDLASESEDQTSSVTEEQIQSVLDSFVKFCRVTGDILEPSDADLHEAFRKRLLNVSSMRIIGRKEGSVSEKKTSKTLVLKKEVDGLSKEEHLEYDLDYLVAQYIVDLRDTDQISFEIVSDIAFASMASEAIACFREPSEDSPRLEGLKVYLDTPLVLDMLGVNSEYSEYGTELLAVIKSSGAVACTLDHCIEEAESAVIAQLASLRSGVHLNSIKYGASVKPDLLSALVNNVAARVEGRLGIAVERDPNDKFITRYPGVVGSIETSMERRMQGWRNEDAKKHDRKSVWSMLCFRDTVTPCRKICDSKSIFVTRNTALVKIANDSWCTLLQGMARHSQSIIEQWAPVSMSDKQFAGYVWLRSGGESKDFPVARLLAHCSSAIRPRADVKAAAINLVLELSGKAQADDIAALLEDREGASALMRATKGDPEDVTPERLPMIVDMVKTAAGEYAARKERELADERLKSQQAAYEEESRRKAEVQAEAERSRTEQERSRALEQARKDSEAELERRKRELELTEAKEKAKIVQESLDEISKEGERQRIALIKESIVLGGRIYRRLRLEAIALFSSLVLLGAFHNFESQAIASILTASLSIFAFWFVPDVLLRPIRKYAEKHMRKYLEIRRIAPPEGSPDFGLKSWGGIERN
ncbi:hypothetical protein IB256_00100 [Pseudomonas sp. PDM17]|uniref:hypothetical protein n=1 Tax=Pseudomonas sp. PDM17 TaxID=2769285 RepID=UPI0017834D17|nr:hypothetical protein [Pseudomonas sp. PDM17]MBD9499161.1 hypothetical protein [Pseudomonas sp. PDM17]